MTGVVVVGSLTVLSAALICAGSKSFTVFRSAEAPGHPVDRAADGFACQRGRVSPRVMISERGKPRLSRNIA